MADCACTNFPGNLGNVTIGASLGIGTMTPGARLDVMSGAVATPVAIKAGRTSEEATLGVSAGSGQWSARADGPGDVVLRSLNGDLILSGQTDAAKILFTTGASDTTKMTLENNGNVSIGASLGVGTASPSGRLDVRGGGTDTHTYFLSGAANKLLSLNVGRASTAGDVVLRSLPGSLVLSAQSGGKIVFATGALGQNDAARLTITNAGNVGINTTAPTDRLHVGGSIRADGAIHTTSQQDITANGDLRADRDLIVANNAVINQDLTAHSSIRAGVPSIKIADGSGCYYA